MELDSSHPIDQFDDCRALPTVVQPNSARSEGNILADNRLVFCGAQHRFVLALYSFLNQRVFPVGILLQKAGRRIITSYSQIIVREDTYCARSGELMSPVSMPPIWSALSCNFSYSIG